MKIAVCVKQVPDSSIISIDPETDTLQRKSAGAVLNPLDEFPIEAALRFKDGIGAHVTVFSMGPPRAEEILARAIAMGADDGILLSDACFAGSDTWATSLILSEALRKYGPFDIVFCGKQAIDGDTAQVGPAIAAHLGWAQAASVSHIEIPSEKDVSEISLTRLFENGYDELAISLPAVIMVLKEACEPRFGTLKGRINYFRKEIRTAGPGHGQIICRTQRFSYQSSKNIHTGNGPQAEKNRGQTRRTGPRARGNDSRQVTGLKILNSTMSISSLASMRPQTETAPHLLCVLL